MNRSILLTTFHALALCLALPGPTFAERSPTEGYAIVVGSNPGGPGQESLRYAEDDANRVADLLVELGSYAADRVDRLTHPTADELLAAIARARARIAPLAAAGKQTRFFFYYSGHARADALNLGRQELPLSQLRYQLLQLPATVSIVVLDACQSGAFSRVKGAGPAADFSFNSVERLNTEGLAVIASSSGNELSQESESLRSSFFTHHWLVGLRGAADRDADGRVTLSEAYQYAYNHTLATTAQTKVGEQHATLETSFKGKDDLWLTHPAAATARLRVPARLTGRVLVQRLPSWSVLAELDKVAGEAVVLALPPAPYAATVRNGDAAVRCNLDVLDGSELTLDPSGCPAVDLEAADSKGPPDGTKEGFIVVLGLGGGWGSHDDAYLRRLRDFQLQNQDSSWIRFTIAAGRRLLDNLVLGLEYFNLASRNFERDLEFEQGFSFDAHAVGPFVQGDIGFGERRAINLFVRAGGGLSIAWTSFDAASMEDDFTSDNPSFENTTVQTHAVTQTFVRPCAWLSAGLDVMPSRYFGFAFEFRYAFAPGIENEFGEVHNLGGMALTAGLRLRSWE
jgi:Caspase domain